MHILRTDKKKRGAALVEYGLLIAGVALITAAAVAVFGNKTNDLIGTVAGVLPSSNAADDAPIKSGKVVKTTTDGNGSIVVDFQNMGDGTNTTDNVFGQGAGALIDD